jgi:hypothetical protein
VKGNVRLQRIVSAVIGSLHAFDRMTDCGFLFRTGNAGCQCRRPRLDGQAHFGELDQQHRPAGVVFPA